MKIHGIRIYPQSVTVVPGYRAPIFVHGSVSDDCSDFFYTFRPIAHLWHNHYFTEDFTLSYDENGRMEDPLPGLREKFGPSLVSADLDRQTVILRGDGFQTWGRLLHFYEGAFLPIYQELPTSELLRQMWNPDVPFTSTTWPAQLRAVLHMWDDIYWQFFTTDRSDLDVLIRAHTVDPKLKMYFVELDREFPDPSNEELQLATLSEKN